MNISIVSVFPQLYDQFLQTSLIQRATETGILNFDLQAYNSFSEPGVPIDAPTFGHGAGMLIKPAVVQAAVEAQEKKHGKAFKIFFSPHGKKLDQTLLKKISKDARERGHLLLLPARYEGMDARVEQEYADEIISIGDFVLMGGDLPAMIFLEGFLRYMPGVVGRPESVERDSFTGAFVDYPEFTKPITWKGHEVPAVVRSGDHAAMEKWRMREAAQRTMLNHFDWFREYPLITQKEKKRAKEATPNHYVVLMHDQVFVGPQAQEGKTSVTSIDIHDIARSTKTFGVEQFFIVTPLEDQQKIVKTLLDFWQTGVGVEYNPKRHEALKDVAVLSNFDDVVAQIEKKEGKLPLIVTTSAKLWPEKTISFHEQGMVWQHDRPVLFVFGTGQGLSDSMMNRADFVLMPILGLSDFNHLSVRSAVATVLDRWMGLNPKKQD